jgi:hypothetical protein
MTLTSVSRISLLLILAGSRLAAAADPAPTNEKPESDTAFITSHMSAVTEVRDQALARNPDPLGTLDAIRRIVALRRDAMAELNAKQPLTSLNGIETMDDYDGEAVLLLHDVTSAYVASDSTRPQAEQLAQFNSVLGGIPALGTSPVGFMVFGLTDIALMVTDTLWSDPQVSRAELAKATINLVHLATDRYAESLGEDHFVDPSFMKKSNRFRTNSVIMRMRCPKTTASTRSPTSRTGRPPTAISWSPITSSARPAGPPASWSSSRSSRAGSTAWRTARKGRARRGKRSGRDAAWNREFLGQITRNPGNPFKYSCFDQVLRTAWRGVDGRFVKILLIKGLRAARLPFGTERPTACSSIAFP